MHGRGLLEGHLRHRRRRLRTLFLGRDAAQDVGVDSMLESPPTEVRAWKRYNDAPLAHVTLHGYPVYLESQIRKLDGNPARAVEWALYIDLVDRALDRGFRPIVSNCRVAVP